VVADIAIELNDIVFDIKLSIFSRKDAKKQRKAAKLNCALASLREINYSFSSLFT
jgi:hypothetical protein